MSEQAISFIAFGVCFAAAAGLTYWIERKNNRR